MTSVPSDHSPMRALPIDLDELLWALTSHDDYLGSEHWLDLETGHIVLTTDDVDVMELADDPRDNERYVRIDSIDSSESFAIMASFVEQLDDPHLARTLAHALEQRKPFRRFKDALAPHPSQRERWFTFEHVALERIARRWCQDSGIAPQWTSPRAPPR